MLLQPGADREDVRIKNNVLGRKADPFGQNFVATRADFFPSRQTIGLPFFVKSHHHDRRAITSNQRRLLDKFLLAFFEADGIDHGLALHALQAGFNHRPARAVNHNRHTSNVRFRTDQVEKMGHGLDAIEHPFVHVDVDDLRAVLDLLTRDGQGFLELTA